LERIARSELGESEDPEDTDEDTGFYYPIGYLLRTWEAYRQFGVLPDAGGINDQCPRWWDDVQTMNRLYIAAIARIKSDKQMSDLLDTSAAVSWTDYHGHE